MPEVWLGKAPVQSARQQLHMPREMLLQLPEFPVMAEPAETGERPPLLIIRALPRLELPAVPEAPEPSHTPEV